MIGSKTFSNRIMLVLAWFPILNIYSTPFVFSWGEFLFLLLMVWSFFNGDKALLSFPRKYIILWAYVAITYIVLSLSNLRLGVLIPGGFSFCLYSVILGFVIAHFDLNSFKRYYRAVFIVAFVILIFQEFTANIMGYRFSALLPFGTLTDGQPISDLINEQLNPRTNRSCSLFREPAHMAQYVIPLLAMELCGDKKKRLVSPMAFAIIASLLLLRSGNGFLGMIVILLVRLIHYVLKENVKHKFLILATTAVVAGSAITYYLSTEMGGSVAERSVEIENDEDAGSYIRIFRGYRLYEEMPLTNKLIGATQNDLISIIPKTSVSFLFKGELQYDLYFNGLQAILLFNGLIGLLLFILVYVGIYKKTTIAGKASILALLAISFVGATYLSYFMLFVTFIAESENRRVYGEDRILHKATV